MYIKSITSGNRLPAVVYKKSKIRKLLGFPWVKLQYIGYSLNGVSVNYGWFKPEEIEGYEKDV